MCSACFWKIFVRMELQCQTKLPNDSRITDLGTRSCTVLHVRARQVQGRDRLGTLQLLSIDYVLSSHKRDLDRHVRVLSGELHVAVGESVQGLLLVQHRLRA